MQLVVRGNDGGIWASTFSETGIFNNDWSLLTGATPSAPAIAWNPGANRMQLVVRGNDGGIWASTFSETGIFNNDWSLLTGATPSAPA